jgi:hypothetical protein
MKLNKRSQAKVIQRRMAQMKQASSAAIAPQQSGACAAANPRHMYHLRRVALRGPVQEGADDDRHDADDDDGADLDSDDDFAPSMPPVPLPHLPAQAYTQLPGTPPRPAADTAAAAQPSANRPPFSGSHVARRNGPLDDWLHTGTCASPPGMRRPPLCVPSARGNFPSLNDLCGKGSTTRRQTSPLPTAGAHVHGMRQSTLQDPDCSFPNCGQAHAGACAMQTVIRTSSQRLVSLPMDTGSCPMRDAPQAMPPKLVLNGRRCPSPASRPTLHATGSDSWAASAPSSLPSQRLGWQAADAAASTAGVDGVYKGVPMSMRMSMRMQASVAQVKPPGCTGSGPSAGAEGGGVPNGRMPHMGTEPVRGTPSAAGVPSKGALQLEQSTPPRAPTRAPPTGLAWAVRDLLGHNRRLTPRKRPLPGTETADIPKETCLDASKGGSSGALVHEDSGGGQRGVKHTKHDVAGGVHSTLCARARLGVHGLIPATRRAWAGASGCNTEVIDLCDDD